MYLAFVLGISVRDHKGVCFFFSTLAFPGSKSSIPMSPFEGPNVPLVPEAFTEKFTS